MRRFIAATAVAVSAVALVVGVAAATPNASDTLVTVGSPPTPFPQNKQNEPAVAVNPIDPSIAAAGVNEERDLEACNNRSDVTCPFTPGIGISGIYFSDTSGSSWIQPTYTGWTARDCLGLVGTSSAPADNCNPHVGPIGTLPRYFENGLVADGDPALFSDHEMVAVDDAADTSKFFGNVYICNAAFRSQEIGGFPEPIVLNSSSDGGDTWITRQLSPSVNNNTIGGRQDCAVNTDSKGNVYVFWDGIDPRTRTLAIFMTRSADGGKTFLRPAQIVTHIDETGIRDPVSGDLTNDGVAGARDGSFPTVDIANGAPTGAGATDEIVLAWSNGPTPSDTHPGPNEQARVMWSKNQGRTWTSAGVASPASDRPDFPAIAISPDGTDAYLTYMAFLQPWQSTNAGPRLFEGVVRHADVNPATGAIGAWSDIHRGPTGDARGSSANALIDEFLGDYDYAFATRDSVTVVWNDARKAADCPAIDAYRQDVANGNAAGVSTDPTRPAPQQNCPATFGNTDIFGGSYADPTP